MSMSAAVDSSAAGSSNALAIESKRPMPLAAKAAAANKPLRACVRKAKGGPKSRRDFWAGEYL
eukprot:305055-Prymnesium_polylepis.1